MPFYTYILKSEKDGRRYIGYTEDINKRLLHHNEGLTPSTKNRRPLKLLCFETFETELESMRFEKYLKSLKGGKVFKKILEELMNRPL